MENWNLQQTEFARNTVNPLRALWERNMPIANPDKNSISFMAGDPTVFGNLPPHPECMKALKDAIDTDTFTYFESAGSRDARQAVADYSRHMGKVTLDDVFLASGCSMAIEFCFVSLANRGENILIPNPAWNYITWLSGPGIEPRCYNLDPSKGWNVDLKHMESLINEKTKAILVNNPGNPCGNVFSKEHLLDIIAIAERHHLPIIADEVYEFFTFAGVEFHSLAGLSKNVPILTCSGLTKRFLIPNIRMGWLIINDRGDRLENVRKGLANIIGRNFGPNCTVQKALPHILKNVPQEFYDKNNEQVGHQALLTFNMLEKIPGLKPVKPKGAMYLMVEIELEKFPNFSSSMDFMQALGREQSVLVFPGECFNYPGFLRFVITAPEEMLIEACKRLDEFCKEHYKD